MSKTRNVEWNFSVGDTHSWWADYFVDSDSGDQQYLVPSTCRAIGTNCYIFVEDAVWNTSQVDQAAVDEIVTAFDTNIYPTDVATFGTPPDVDGDPKIIILILNILDGFNPADGGGYVAGYFYSLNEQTDSGIDGTRSNVAEIFYMDCNPADLITNRTNVLNTTAHEFQHMIHYAHGYPEMTFINEGLSEIASYICGYGLRSNGLYAQDPNVQLFEWDNGIRDVLADYSRAAFWTLYLYEQYPNTSLIKDLVNNQHADWTKLDNELRKQNPTRGFISVLTDWLIANYTNGKSNDIRYNYDYDDSPLSKSSPANTHFGNSGQGSGTLEYFGAEYITFSGGDDLSITFTGGTIFKVKALKIGSLEVEDVPKNIAYSPTGYGTTYPEVTFLVYNESAGSKQNYSYIATGADISGTFELAYEDGVPDGYAPAGTWAHPGDSVAVKFDGIEGAILDSVRFAFRRNGTIQMDISQFDGISFLRGHNLFGPVQVNSPDSTAAPYPDPYENWVTYDLSVENIDASNDFVVSLLLGNNTSEPGIMVSAETTSGHSYWYDLNSDSWKVYTAEGGKIWNYFIRAYVSIGGTTVLTQPTITSIVANQGNIKLSWNTSGGPVAGYNIYRSTATGFIPDLNNKIGFVGNAISSYTDEWPNFQANTAYFYRISSFDWSGNESDYSDEVSITTLEVNDKNGIPVEYSLNSNYPNPFNPSTTFNFGTPQDGLVKFTVHDLLGRVVYSENRNLLAGNYSFTWEGNNMLNQQAVSGVYFLRMEAEGFVQTRKMLMMK